MAAMALVGACVLTAVAPLQGGAQATGSITGIVTMDNPPAASTVEATADQAVCGETLPNEEIIADTAGHVANAVVRVAGVPWPADVNPPTLNNAGFLAADQRFATPSARPKKRAFPGGAADGRYRSALWLALRRPAPSTSPKTCNGRFAGAACARGSESGRRGFPWRDG